nr:disulfide bond formation protein B [Brucella intermedia]
MNPQPSRDIVDTNDAQLGVLLNYIYALSMMVVLAAILSTAMVFQYAWNELPCPLCLLQRVAMFGVCFGLIMHFRFGFSYQYTGISMVSTVFLLIVSVRQTLLDIYPRPGHEYVGTSILGIHMPVWSAIIATALVFGFSLQFIFFGNIKNLQQPLARQFPWLNFVALAVSLYVIAIGVINFVSVGVQCGLGQCHTMGYALLK